MAIWKIRQLTLIIGVVAILLAAKPVALANEETKSARTTNISNTTITQTQRFEDGKTELVKKAGIRHNAPNTLELEVWRVENGKRVLIEAWRFIDGAKALSRKNYSEALRNWQRLANEGEAQSQRGLAVLYDSGLGVEKDQVKAAMWLERAADLGDAEAQSMFGIFNMTGRGIPQDFEEARFWLPTALKKGELSAAKYLGTLYLNGAGVTEDRDKGIRLIRQAAESGDAEAQVLLGVAILPEEENEGELDEAIKWFEIAARHGNSQAFANLGKLSLIRAQNSNDVIRAAVWLTLVDSNIDENTKKFLTEAQAKLSRAQFELSKELAEKCRKSRYFNCPWIMTE